jgi:hypothetical protein
MTSRVFAAAATMLVAVSLRAGPPAYTYYPDIRAACEKIAHMRIGPGGVTRAQANLLADTYFQIYLGQCGGAEPVQQMKGFWNAPVVVGYAGVRDGALRIDRPTGVVSYRDKPTLLPKDFPHAFLREYAH